MDADYTDPNEARRSRCQPWWSEKEMDAIEELAAIFDLSPVQVMRGALRLYQSRAKGACRVEWKTPPAGCPDLTDEVDGQNPLLSLF